MIINKIYRHNKKVPFVKNVVLAHPPKYCSGQKRLILFTGSNIIYSYLAHF